MCVRVGGDRLISAFDELNICTVFWPSFCEPLCMRTALSTTIIRYTAKKHHNGMLNAIDYGTIPKIWYYNLLTGYSRTYNVR